MRNNNYIICHSISCYHQERVDRGRERGKGVEYPNSIDTVIELRGSNTKKKIGVVWKWNIIARKYCSITSVFCVMIAFLFNYGRGFYFMQNNKFANAIIRLTNIHHINKHISKANINVFFVDDNMICKRAFLECGWRGLNNNSLVSTNWISSTTPTPPSLSLLSGLIAIRRLNHCHRN